MDIHTAEQLLPEHSLVEVEIVNCKLKWYKSPIKAGGETLRSEIHKLIHSVWNKVELPQQWKESITVLIHEEVDKIVIIIEESPSYQMPTKF
jgi:hypothetical protein